MLAKLIALFVRIRPLLPWLRQTSTIAGIATVAATAAGMVSGSVTVAAAIPMLAGAAVAMAMPGHPEAQAAVEQAARDAVILSDRTRRADALPIVLGDVALIVKATDIPAR